MVHSNTEFLFVLNSVLGNRDNRADLMKTYERVTSAPSGELQRKVKELIGELKIPSACRRLLEFKTTNGRGLPWSIKKEATLLLSFITDGYVFPMPTDHRELVEILDYMSYFSQKGLLSREEEEKKTLQLILSLVVSGNFEGRLRGLNEMKRMVEYPLKRKDSIIAEITNKDLLSFLIENKNFNIEMFKRSLPIFEFAFKNKLLTKDHLSRILM